MNIFILSYVHLRKIIRCYNKKRGQFVIKLEQGKSSKNPIRYKLLFLIVFFPMLTTLSIPVLIVSASVVLPVASEVALKKILRHIQLPQDAIIHTWFAPRKKKLPCLVSKILSFESTKLLILSASCWARDCNLEGSLRCITTVWVGSSKEAWKPKHTKSPLEMLLKIQ